MGLHSSLHSSGRSGPSQPIKTVQPWNLQEGRDQPHRGELDQACIPTWQVEESGKIPSSLLIPHSQTKDSISGSIFLQKCYLWSNYRRAVHRSSQLQAHRQADGANDNLQSATLDFSKLVDFKMASRNLTCLITDKLLCLGKARVRLIKTTPQSLTKIRPRCKEQEVKQSSSQRPQEVFTCFQAEYKSIIRQTVISKE